MRFIATALPGVMRVALDRHEDERGWFARLYCEDEFRAAGLDPVGVQCSLSHNRARHTLRGLHWQAEPAGEAKLVRCVAGRMFDVAVDVRPGSPAFRRWIGVTLEPGGEALHIPRGCAHGFLTLADDTTVLYQMGARFDAAAARGARWNDPGFAIEWPAPPAAIAPRDADWPDFRP